MKKLHLCSPTLLILLCLALGNYVATIEGKQTFQKSDVLIVRIYTNWEPDSTDYTISNKRYVRPRIAGMVTPSNTLGDADYLDMIEIPINFMSPTTITCCQVLCTSRCPGVAVYPE